MSESISADTVVVRSDGFLATEMEDELAMMSIESNSYFVLDDIGKVIWTELEKPITVEALCEALLVRYDVDRAQCFTDVVGFLNELYGEKIIELV